MGVRGWGLGAWEEMSKMPDCPHCGSATHVFTVTSKGGANYKEYINLGYTHYCSKCAAKNYNNKKAHLFAFAVRPDRTVAIRTKPDALLTAIVRPAPDDTTAAREGDSRQSDELRSAAPSPRPSKQNKTLAERIDDAQPNDVIVLEAGEEINAGDLVFRDDDGKAYRSGRAEPKPAVEVEKSRKRVPDKRGGWDEVVDEPIAPAISSLTPTPKPKPPTPTPPRPWMRRAAWWLIRAGCTGIAGGAVWAAVKWWGRGWGFGIWGWG